jgi:predicted ribosome quality control (RQC) complex YloA/Tae2 family protein
LYHLWIRLWSGNPNIILTDENNIIIDVYFRKPDKGEIQGKIFNPDFSMGKQTGIERSIRDYTSAYDFNSYINSFYQSNEVSNNFESLQAKKIKKVTLKINKIRSHLGKLKKRKIRFSSWDIIKKQGELIRANLYRVKKGDQFLDAEDYFLNNEIVHIELKPELPPDQNCDFYFNKYKKYRTGLKIVEEEIEIQEKLLRTQEELLIRFESCKTPEELTSMSPPEPKSNTKLKTRETGLSFTSEDFEILVGRNAKENTQLLRRSVRGNDMWLHVRDYPGGYVFIKSKSGKTIPLNILLDGANLALLYSGKKYKDKADIHYTQVKNLRRIKGGKEGLVLAQNEKNLYIKYDENRINKLQQKSRLETKALKIDN